MVTDKPTEHEKTADSTSPMEKLRDAVAQDTQRMDKAERARRSPLGLLIYGGTVGLLFITPIVGGAYLGRWIDMHFAGYSVRWTVSLIVMGIVLGAWNVQRFIRED